jgi:methanogenic corrinoid protein MtbC1
MRQDVLEKYMEPLLSGDRSKCRQIVHEMLESQRGDARLLYDELIWPAMEKVELLFRKDVINTATEHMATRINRSLADQIQRNLTRKGSNGNRILVMCADGEPEELGAQMCADLFEADGWDTFFLGGGIPNDEVLTLVGQLRPDILLIFGTQPQGVPNVRLLTDQIREIGANPTMNIMVSGGVFNRADGLWKEIRVDLFAETAREALEVANAAEARTPELRSPGAPKKRRRRRRPPLLAEVGA